MEQQRGLPYGDVWFEQVENVHRWLAGNDRVPFVRFTDTPGPGDVSYWLAALYIMKYLLSWEDVPAAILALLEVRSPEGPARLLTEVWGREGLQAMAWWLREQELSMTSPGEGSLASLDSFAGAARRCGFTGGSDPKHLLGHMKKHGFLSTDRVESTVIRQGRRVALFVDRLEEVPGALSRLGSTTALGPPSVRVHVTARCLGYLGMYRACWVCSRWMQGPARFHLLGHALNRG